MLFIQFLLGCSASPDRGMVVLKKGDNIVLLKNLCHPENTKELFDKCDWRSLSKRQMAEHSEFLDKSVHLIVGNLNAPQKDNSEYEGAMSFCLNREGAIESIELTKPSGNKELDRAFEVALLKTAKLLLPQDNCVIEKLYFKPTKLYYDETDMVE